MQKNQGQTNYLKDKIQGALWGAVLGDVIGAYLQFDNDVTKQKITNAFKIIGGGKHKLQPGQPTDDSQLNYAVCKGLTRGNGTINLNYIAQQMGNWFLSKPIDIGGTIRKSIPKACNMKVHQAHLCRKGAKQSSQTSQSNGSLMALIGLAVFCHRLCPDEIIKVVRQYTILIHPHEIVSMVNSFYTLMISYILAHNQIQDSINIYQFAKSSIFQHKNIFKDPKILDQFSSWLELIQSSFNNNNNIQILQNSLSLNKQSGWVRIAFSYSCYFIVSMMKKNQYKQYNKVIEYLISNKGDTDTNACIVGGIIGTIIGRKMMKMDQQIEKINKWRPKIKKRPEWMVPGLVIDKLVEFFIEKSPKQLVIIGSQSQYDKKQKK